LTLDEFYDYCWKKLQRARVDRKSPFRTPALLTLNNNIPAGRTIVLRQVDIEKWQLWFHTRADSAKASELAENPRSALLFYSKKDQLQLRVAGQARLLVGSFAVDLWSKSSPAERLLYFAPQAPGVEINEPGPLPAIDEKQLREAPVPETFASLEFQIEEIDALQLSRDFHRRAFFSQAKRCWLQP
jgi:pyridoxine/pyridoxamine 5'-phosphate oxidase